MPGPEPLRFADILTTASAIANYLGQPDVDPSHLIAAVAILRGQKTMEDLGRPVSPLVRRPAPPGATEAVRALVQRWFADLGEDPNAELSPELAERLLNDLRTPL
jgi:hypothetical protein